MQLKYISILIIIILIQSCQQKSKQIVTNSNKADKQSDQRFINQYAGGYTVEVDSYKGTTVEVYILKKDRTAEWMWIKNSNGNAVIDDDQKGNWSAKSGDIAITCQGKNEASTEEFILKNGKFYDTLTGTRYLKLKQ